jgi:hypothetical protein
MLQCHRSAPSMSGEYSPSRGWTVTVYTLIVLPNITAAAIVRHPARSGE